MVKAFTPNSKDSRFFFNTKSACNDFRHGNLSLQDFLGSLHPSYAQSASSSSQSSVLLNKDRILTLKKDAVPDDSIWFLQVLKNIMLYALIFVSFTSLNMMIYSIEDK